MNELIYSIDNWTIVKLLGGVSFILITILGGLFFLIKNRLLDKWKAKDKKEIETLKGMIDRNNSVLTTILARGQSEHIVNKRLEALETIWKFVITTKDRIPTYIRLGLSILMDDEFTIASLNKISKGQIERISFDDLMKTKPQITDYEDLRFLLPTNLWTLVFIYQATINRTCYLTLDGVQKENLTYWKSDTGIKTMLSTVLDDKEIEYIYKTKIQAFDILLNLLEHKILTDTNRILSGESHTEDNLKVIKQITEILKKD
ncbi:MAG: hypothetical protein WCO28_11340 [Bacteroidota bacterium]